MSAIPQLQPEFAEVVEQSVEQMVHLPRSVHVMARQFRVEQTGDSLRFGAGTPAADARAD